MTALPKICAVSGCVEQARPGRSYCAEHERLSPPLPIERRDVESRMEAGTCRRATP